MMKKGHFLYSAFTALHGQLPVPEDVVYEGSRLLALCEAGSHASLPTRRAMGRLGARWLLVAGIPTGAHMGHSCAHLGAAVQAADQGGFSVP